MNARPDGIDRDHVPVLVRTVQVYRLYDEELFAN